MIISRPCLTCLLLGVMPILVACGPEAGEEPARDTTMGPGDTLWGIASALPRTTSPEGASVFFIIPADGDTVSSPVFVEFGLQGMAVVKAGDEQPESGHHHLIIDAQLPDLALPIPADDNYRHFGDASTSTEVTLDPGEHTLRLLLGDHRHIPHDPPLMSDTITIVVE
jgi:hypothetical protein